MIDRLEHFFRTWRRRVSRSEWAIPLLGLPVSEGTATEPGLVLIQIDGLSRLQMERAMERGRLPFLRKLIQREHYEARTFYSGLPSSTPAVQGELYYGAPCAVPAFSFLDSGSRRIVTMFNTDAAKALEARLQKNADGLLKGGSSWSNIFTGGATSEESHFCAGSLGLGDVFRARPLLNFLSFPILQFPAVARMAGLLFLEFFIAFWDMLHGVFRGESFLKELKCVFARVVVCIALRELVTIGAKIDTARGLPVIHLNFLGYDEQSHRRGPSSAFAHWSLKGIDRAIKNIYRAAQRSARRDYQVWIFSDHGQEATRFFGGNNGAELEQVIHEALEGFERKRTDERRRRDRFSRAHLAGGRRGRRRLEEWLEMEPLTETEEESFTIAAMGPVGHLYLVHPEALAQKRALAKRLVCEGRVPGVLLRSGEGTVEWIHSGGKVLLPDEVPDFLPHSDEVKREIVRDLVALCEHERAGDLVLLGWKPEAAPLSFINERGAHAGPGPEETQGFVLLPPLTRLPDRVGEFLRPSDLRATALHHLERQAISPGSRKTKRAVEQRLRVMTYNVHSCRGMDGRISPRRIAKVIERYDPDLVALQELDLGRVRSQHHDQPRLIAEALGMELCFCPTVVVDDEQYGHAILSRFPMDVIRTEILTGRGWRRFSEPRGALWVRMEIDGLRLHLMNTHFGLSRRERIAQAADLLGEKWIGGIEEDEPLILCGDFNMFPRSQPYRALARRLRDVQEESDEFLPLNTFTTFHPFARIDHIFVSRHFVPEKIMVPRNHLTRVASDHLPLITDLVYEKVAPAATEPQSDLRSLTR